MRTTYRFKDTAVRKAFMKFIEDPQKGMIKGPFISLKAPFISADPGTVIPLDIAPSFPPYQHQVQAFEQLTTKDGHNPQNTLITTGTGSGKTECFLFPILDYCYQHIGEKGIKVIIMYPMNALATDQAKRLAEAIYADERLRGKVTAGLFIGKGLTKKEFQSSMGQENIIEDAKEIVSNPPDILLTNFKMLDYGLMKSENASLWSFNKKNPTLLKYIILDELHTYDGAQGTDVANLIRRLKLCVGVTTGQICGIGTSATIGEGEDSKSLLCNYASDIFGEEFKTENVIEEHRKPASELFSGEADPTLPSKRRVGRLAMRADETHDDYIRNQMEIWEFENDEDEDTPVALTHLLSSYQIVRDIFSICEENGIIECQDLITKLSEKNILFNAYEENVKIDVIGSLLALIAEAKIRNGKILVPFLPLQVQLWIRELSGIRRVVAPVPVFTWKTDVTSSDDKTIALPMYYCRECGASGWIAVKGQTADKFEADGSIASSHFMDNDPNVWLINTAEESHQPESSFDVITGKLEFENLKIFPSTATNENTMNFIAVQKKESGRNKTLHSCPECYNGADDLSIVGSKSATLSSLAISQILSSNLDGTTDDKRKILTFTNSVQDAAHLSSFIMSRIYRFTLRASIQKVIEMLESEGKTPNIVSTFERFKEYWKGECQTQRAYLYRFFPTDYEGKIDLSKDYKLDENTYKPAFLEEFDTRLYWEIVSEFGFTSTIGRSLEITGSSAAYYNPEDIQATYEQMKPFMEANGIPASFEEFAHFLIGFLNRTRLHGGIDHPYLEKFRDTLRRWDINWRNDRRHFLNRIFGPQGRIPKVLIAFQNDFNKANTFDSTFAVKTGWYFSYFKACFQLAPDYAPLSNDFYQKLVKVLSEVGLFSERHGSEGDNYVLNPEKIYLSAKVKKIKCTNCQSAIYTAEADSLSEGTHCITNRCGGTYSELEEIPSNYYQRIYRREKTPRIYSHEHTGLLDRELRERIEKDFKERPQPDSINSLVATSTLEMGIDIGDLNAELNVSIPPQTSNYLQRVGRAGRKSGAALIVDFAKSDPHDLFFYEDPQEMMSGKINTPGCFLNAKDILRRHFFAYCIDSWTAENPDSHKIPSRLAQLHLHTDFVTSPDFFMNKISLFIQNNLGKLSKAFCQHYSKETVTNVLIPMFEIFQNGSFEAQVRLIFSRLRNSYIDVTGKMKSINDDIKIRNLSPNDPEYKELKDQHKLLYRQRTEIRKKTVLEFMTDEGLLPNYAFPETGVKLSASILGSTPEGEGAPAEIKDCELVRPASSGLTDLAPGNNFYFDGMKLKVDGINTADWQTEGSLFRMRFCSKCDAIEPDSPTHSAMCPKCGDPSFGAASNVHTYVNLHNVKSNQKRSDSIIDDSKDDRDITTYRKSFHFRFNPNAVTVSYGMKEIPFGIEYVKNVKIFESNLGESMLTNFRNVDVNRIPHVPLHGFVTCRYCGKAVANPDIVMNISDDTKRKRQWHYPYCKHKNDEYNCKSDEIFEEVFLAREFQTEAIKILLPVQQIDSEATTAMFIAGLNLGLRHYFKGNPSHIRMREYYEFNEISERFDSYVIMYDTIPGGTGYLAKLFDTKEFSTVLRLAYEKIANCECKTEGKDGCYHCILTYENQFRRLQLSRSKAEALFKRIVDKSENWEVYTSSLGTVSGAGGIEESELEDRFLTTLKSACENKNWMFKVLQGVSFRYYQIQISEDNGEIRTYTIHPQYSLGPAQNVQLTTVPDFYFECTDRIKDGVTLDKDEVPGIAVFLDGYAYHGKNTDGMPRFFGDIKKREAVCRSGNRICCTLTWEDLSNFIDGKDDSMFIPSSERNPIFWTKTEFHKLGNAFDRFLYCLLKCGTPALTRDAVLYFAAWIENKKYADMEDYLSFRSPATPSADGSGFFISNAPDNTSWMETRIAVLGNTFKYAMKTTATDIELDKRAWNHFWNMHNLLCLGPDSDQNYLGSDGETSEDTE